MGDIRSVDSERHADDLDAVCAQQSLKIDVARIVHDDRIAWMQKKTADEIDRLCPGGGQEYLVSADIQPLIRELAGKELAQRERPAGRAIVRKHRIIGPSETSQGAADRCVRQSVGRQPADRSNPSSR